MTDCHSWLTYNKIIVQAIKECSHEGKFSITALQLLLTDSVGDDVADEIINDLVDCKIIVKSGTSWIYDYEIQKQLDKLNAVYSIGIAVCVLIIVPIIIFYLK